MRRLVVFGDSWPKGHRKLPKLPLRVHKKSGRPITGFDPIQKPFPNLIADKLGIECLNLSVSSHSNFAIANDFWEYVTNDRREDDIVLVVWTNWNRMTLMGNCKKTYDMNPRNHSFKDRFTAYATGDFTEAKLPQTIKLYGKREDTTNTLKDDFYKLLQSVSAYHMVKDICREKDISFLQISSICHDGFNNKIRPVWNKDDPDWIECGSDWNTLCDILLNKWLIKSKKPAFIEWIFSVRRVHERKGIQGLNEHDLHPNEEGHELIAETLAPYIKRKLEE